MAWQLVVPPATDTLFGDGSADWFFALLSGFNKDKVKDAVGGEVVVDCKLRSRLAMEKLFDLVDASQLCSGDHSTIGDRRHKGGRYLRRTETDPVDNARTRCNSRATRKPASQRR
jgi:hypothetical protein